MQIDLSPNAIKVLEARYLWRDSTGRPVETAESMFRRVARHVAQAESQYGDGRAVAHWEKEFFALLARRDFLPNSPTLMNAGTPLGQLSACFVLPVEDSMVEIFDALKLMALIQQSGGGTGFSFSHLRPRGDRVASTGGEASGPVSFMRIFDCATENIRQGGKRRGANMGVLRVDHPDIEEFIAAKLDGRSFQNFNLSVAVTDEFMEAALADQTYTLRNPRTGEPAGQRSASEVLAQIANAAWRTGDPGMIFYDAINRANPTPSLGALEATNPCGEVPLLAYEACNLGSINLAHMLCGATDDRQLDWDKLRETVQAAMRFLDNVIEVGRWPFAQIEKIVHGNRKVGLGVMGFADLLIELGVPYASDAAVEMADRLMQFVSEEARAASAELASRRGVFPNWNQSIYAEQDLPLRNATCTSIAPTGTISILADASASIEPLFALAYRRENVLGKESLPELNPSFLRYAQEHGFYSAELARQLTARGNLADLEGVPTSAKKRFATALEIGPEDHLRIQAAFQKHVDNAVSKTINLPEEATAEEILQIYQQAWQLGTKGVTVFRYGSKSQQVLELGAGESPEEHEHFVRCDPDACKL